MNILEQQRPVPTALPGVSHVTWAGAADGLEQISVWRQDLAPGTATPPHRHDCDEVVMCLGGCGELQVDGERLPFAGGAILVLPKGQVHQIYSIGPAPLETLAVLGRTPVPTCLPDGAALPLPWRS